MATVRLNLVARDQELSRLDAAVGAVLRGDGQVLFVRGESGAGKTSLVTEFAARSQSGHPELVVPVGRCDPQSGRGDAFLPFREVLQTLTGDTAGTPSPAGPAPEEANSHKVRSLSREAVSALGPSLVGLFIPGGALLANVGLMMARKKTTGHRPEEVAALPVMDAAVDQDQILEQYVHVLRRLGRELPLIVVLDDLQWADTASLALLARIGRRLDGTKILVIGTYRTSDVTLGEGEAQHPLEPVVNELTRQFGDITLAAYAFAWMDFPGRDWLFIVIVGLLVVPVQVALIPVAGLFGDLGIYGTRLSVILFHVAFGLPFAVFLLRNFFAGIPKELLEAARMDGAGEWRIFRSVVMPLGLPAIASLGIFQFLWVWNDMLVALVFADSSAAPLTVALQSQARQFGSNIDVLATGAFLSLVVPLVVFFSFQRYFEQGVLAGSVK